MLISLELNSLPGSCVQCVLNNSDHDNNFKNCQISVISHYVCYFFAGTRLKKVITGLEESLDIKTKESEHLQSLVTKMEATPGQDEMNKVQITDLKGELAKSEETLKFRTEELLQVKKELRHSDPKLKILFGKSTISSHKIFS